MPNGTLELIVKRGPEQSEWESVGQPVTGLDPMFGPLVASAIWAITGVAVVDEPNPHAVAQWTCTSADFYDSLLSFWPETEVPTVPVPVEEGE